MRSHANDPTPASSLPNQFLLLLIIALLFTADLQGGGRFALAATLLLLPLIVGFASLYTIHVALVFLASYLVFQLIPPTPAAVLAKSSGLVLYFYIVLLITPLRRSIPWLRPGRFNHRATLFLLVIVVGSAIGVIAWEHFAAPNLNTYSRMLPPGIRRSLLPVYMAGFAILNSLIEEIIWRGIMLTALDAAFGAGLFALLLQAAQFGMAHYRGGFPSGWIGALLASVFGLLMGMLRRRTNGLLVPWCAHAMVDLTIIILVAYRAGAH